MEFNLQHSIAVLERTPKVLNAWLQDLPEVWTHQNEGDQTWSPFDVMGHLIHGEQTDWIPRAMIILSDVEDKSFVPFDRFAQFEHSQGKTLSQLLEEFTALRQQNLDTLQSLDLSAEDWGKTGIHPEFGAVTLRQLIATWVAHDLSHLAQIARVMAKQYKQATGPWERYLGVLHR